MPLRNHVETEPEGVRQALGSLELLKDQNVLAEGVFRENRYSICDPPEREKFSE